MLKVLQNAPKEAFCNTFNLHKAIIGIENQFLVFLRVAVLRRFFCISRMMRSVLCGVVLCLLLAIPDNNMITEGSVITITKYTLKWMACCSKNCKLGDFCYPSHPSRPSGCKCYRHDKRYTNGGYMTFYKS